MQGHMGDRALITADRPKALEKSLEVLRKKNAMTLDPSRNKKRSKRSVLDLDESALLGTYAPRTKESAEAYASFLSLIATHIGDTTPGVLHGAADLVLSILKDENMRAPEQQTKTSSLLHTALDNDAFAALVHLAQGMKDYDTHSMNDEEPIELALEEEEEIEEEEEEEEEGLVLADGSTHVPSSAQTWQVDPLDVDAYWMERQLLPLEDDAQTRQHLAKAVLEALDGSDARAAESGLVKVLGRSADRFSLIKLLLKNRFVIVYCSKLVHAQSEEEKETLRIEMGASEEGVAVLQRLSGSDQNLVRETTEEAVGERVHQTIPLVDLENLAFPEGDKLLSSTFVMPPDAERIRHRDYEVVYVPGKELSAEERNRPRVRIDILPDWAQPAFEGVTSLNHVQSRVFSHAFQTPLNMLLCAPTGAGKTNCALLTILHEIGASLRPDGTLDKDAFKIVYIAPMKSLVREMVDSFRRKLAHFGVSVSELSGDQSLSSQQIQDTQVIVSTPEKWDIVTRKGGEKAHMDLLSLLIMDEIHLLHDGRGPVLESLIARSLRHTEQTGRYIRLVGLSATLPNYDDVAALLRVQPEGLFVFDASFRPVPLELTFMGVSQKNAFKRFQRMNELTYEECAKRAGRHQVLVFCHSRSETYKTAKAVMDMAASKGTLDSFLASVGSRVRDDLLALVERDETKPDSEELAELLPHGFAMHHAGLSRKDRELVEDAFREGKIQVLVSTATLAWGVNLPAHTVLIKGTRVYSPERGAWVELSGLDVQQMLGRAGRPGYDTSGEGIILTTQSELPYYLQLMNAQLPVESHMMSRLVDQLNAEIVLRSVTCLSDAVDWLGYTYLYVCMMRSPTLYGIPVGAAAQDPYLRTRRTILAHSAAVALEQVGMIVYHHESGQFRATEAGKVAAHYYVSHASLRVYQQHLNPDMSDMDMLRVFSLSEEFRNIAVRSEEQSELERLLARVPIPVRESANDGSAKVNVLVQVYISRLQMSGLVLLADMVYITQSAGRLFRALFTLCLRKKWARVALRYLEWALMVQHQQWSTQSPLRAFQDWLGDDLLRRMERQNFPFARMYDLSARELGTLVNVPSKGDLLYQAMQTMPKLQVQAHVQPILHDMMRVELTIQTTYVWNEAFHQRGEPWWFLCVDHDGGEILHAEYWIGTLSSQEQYLDFVVPLKTPMSPHYLLWVVSDRWLGVRTTLPIVLRTMVVPQGHVPFASVLDMAPLPIDEALGGGECDALQTHVKGLLRTTDMSVLISAPEGFGQQLCAEFAILQSIDGEATGPIVVLCPHTAQWPQRLSRWSQCFEPLGLDVLACTGHRTMDAKLLQPSERRRLLLATPQQWDAMSRRWKQRSSIARVSLIIAEDVHRMDTTYEVCLTRVRIMQQQQDHPTRLVAFAAPTAAFEDLRTWLGVSTEGAVLINPGMRSHALQLRVIGFDQVTARQRSAAQMQEARRRTAGAVAQGERVLLVTPDASSQWKMVRALTGEAQTSTQTLEAQFTKDLSKRVREAAEQGIAVLSFHGSTQERNMVKLLFATGVLSCMVGTLEDATALDASCAHTVLLVGTQAYHTVERRFIEVPIHQLLQAVSLAQLSCVVLCASTTRVLYVRMLTDVRPLESVLDESFADVLTAEVASGVIGSKQEAVDYLTWTFLYRRIRSNPNYYGLLTASEEDVSGQLSDLVEEASDVLDGVVLRVDDMQLSILNMGMVAAYYAVQGETILIFAKEMQSNASVRDIVALLSRALEWTHLGMHPGRESDLMSMARRMPIATQGQGIDAYAKVLILLQAHFARMDILPWRRDMEALLPLCRRLLEAMVDVAASHGYLRPALACMETMQMLVQGVWQGEVVKQIPHYGPWAEPLKSVYDLLDMEDDARAAMLQGLPVDEIAAFCNAYPSVQVDAHMSTEEDGSTVVNVRLERDVEMEEDDWLVFAPRYPQTCMQGWWVVVGVGDRLAAIRRVLPLKQTAEMRLVVEGEIDGNMVVYAMCDSVLGADHEKSISL